MPSEAAQKYLDSFNRPIIDALESEGITLKRLSRQLKAELRAKETKFFQKDGIVVETRDVIAWDVRQKARIDAHKLRGDYPSDKLDVTHHGIREVLEALDGRSTGLPSQREVADGDGS